MRRDSASGGNDSTRRPRRGVSRRVLVGGALALGVLGAFVGAEELHRGPASPATPRALPPATALPGPTGGGSGPQSPHGSANPVVATAAAAPTAIAPGSAKQPNVLLVTIDTFRADRLGAYGYAAAHTPTLDQLAREGVRCDHAICQLPQTNPSHAALMCGLYASTSGVKVHMVDKLRPGSQTLATIFQAAGYQTAGIYSWVSLDSQFCGLDQGFQTYQGYVLNRGTVFANPALEQAAATYREVKSSVPIVQTVDQALGASADYEATMDGRADVTNKAVLAWLDAHAASAPFFLWVHYFDPHYPYSPPAGYDHILGLDYHGTIDGSVDTIHKIENGQLRPTPDDLARLAELYQGEVAFADAQFGRVLARLAKLGVAEDTIVVVAGDHGESFGEHGDWTHGLKVFETEIRVPLLLHFPRRLPAGAVVTAPVQLIDVLPTLLDLTGLTAKQPIQGTSFLPLINGAVANDTRAAFTELADESFVSVLTYGDWKLIRNDANGQLQLYNLKADEPEQQNLAQDEAQTASELNARLQDLMVLSGVSK